MKKICVLSYERTGSTWLMDLFNCEDSISIGEPFSDDPTLIYYNLIRIFNMNKILNKNIINVFSKIYHPNNIFTNPQQFTEVKRKMLNSNPFNFEYLLGLLEEIKKAKKNFIAFKIFPSHIKNNITIEKIISISDVIIFNYRNNLLDTYISHFLATESGAWFKSTNFRESNYNEIKLMWNINKYINYTNHVIQNKFLFFKNIFDTIKKKKILLSYEQIHNASNFLDKIQNLNNLFKSKDLILQLSNQEDIFKQNNRNYEEIFINKEEFLQDLPKIRKFIYV